MWGTCECKCLQKAEVSDLLGLKSLVSCWMWCSGAQPCFCARAVRALNHWSHALISGIFTLPTMSWRKHQHLCLWWPHSSRSTMSRSSGESFRSGYFPLSTLSLAGPLVPEVPPPSLLIESGTLLWCLVSRTSNMAVKDRNNSDVEARNLGIVVLAFRAENLGKVRSLRSPYSSRKWEQWPLFMEILSMYVSLLCILSSCCAFNP